MNAFASFGTWFKNKLGRITAGAGIVLQGIETVDLSVIKDPLESIIGHKGVQVAIIALFVISYLRHQYVASKIAPKPEVLPPPVTEPK